jgi:hypothetical protein
MAALAFEPYIKGQRRRQLSTIVSEIAGERIDQLRG